MAEEDKLNLFKKFTEEIRLLVGDLSRRCSVTFVTSGYQTIAKVNSNSISDSEFQVLKQKIMTTFTTTYPHSTILNVHFHGREIHFVSRHC